MPNRTFYANGSPQQVNSRLAPAPSFLLANNDITNPVYVGESRSVSTSGSDVVQIPPLGSLVFDGQKDIWIVTTGPNVQTFQIPGATQWTPSPAQVAAQISALGLAKDTSVQATTTAVGGVPAGIATTGITGVTPALLVAQQSFPSTAGVPAAPFTVTYPVGGSYLFTCTTTGSNSQISDILVEHLDAGNNAIYTDSYTVGVGGVGNFSPVIVRGNLMTNKIRVTVTTCNLAYINALGLITGPFTIGPLLITVYGTALAVAESRPKVIPSNTQGGLLQEIAGIALGAGASQGPVPIPSYAGRAIVDVFSPGTLARATLQGFRVNTAATPQFTIRCVQVTAGSVSVSEIVIPQFFMTLLELNGDSVARTPGVNVVSADYV